MIRTEPRLCVHSTKMSTIERSIHKEWHNMLVLTKKPFWCLTINAEIEHDQFLLYIFTYSLRYKNTVNVF